MARLKRNEVMHLMKVARAPSILALIVGYLFLTMPSATFHSKYIHTETFAGDQSVTQAWRTDGFNAAALDIKYAGTMDILSDHGFMVHVLKILQTDLATTMAPVCSSWGKMNAYTSGRSKCKPMGRTYLKYVSDANVMASRVMLNPSIRK